MPELNGGVGDDQCSEKGGNSDDSEGDGEFAMDDDDVSECEDEEESEGEEAELDPSAMANRMMHRAHLEKGLHMFTGLVPFRTKAGPVLQLWSCFSPAQCEVHELQVR